MPRYIRTKDKIFKTDYHNDEKGYYITTDYCDYKDSEVKVANTIEELCDEYVGIDSQGHYIIHNDEFIKGVRIVPLEKVSYYGAIWTDKGLIYVAKMNEKGDLELL